MGTLILLSWYQWEYLRSPAKEFIFSAGYLRLAMIPLKPSKIGKPVKT